MVWLHLVVLLCFALQPCVRPARADEAGANVGAAHCQALEFDASGVPQALRCTSGRIVSDEGLRDGAWIARYWSPIGRPEINPVCRGDAKANAAFGLSIDGAAVSNRWAVVKMVVRSGDAAQPMEGKVRTLTDGMHAEVVLRHAEQPVEVAVHTLADGTGLFTRWLTLRNTGTAPWALSALEVWSGRVFPCQFGDRYWGENSKYFTAHGDYEIGSFIDNRHSNEGHFEWRPLGDAPFELSETSGKSGWGHPILYLRDGKAGNIFVMQLAWSGNWRLRAAMVDGRVHAGIGPFGPGNLRVVAPGESIRTPEVHFGGMAGDLSEMAQALHAHQRRSVLPAWDADRCGLISYNHWSYMNHEMSEERLIREIDIAADLGAEVFTIDAGWYGNLGEDWHVTGNWHPGNRLPNGLAPVFAHARKRGLKCGLWFWIEAASENSPIIRAHPDWLIDVAGKRMNNHLDLSKPEVAAWVESEIERAIGEYGIDLFRLDYNTYPGKGGTHLRDGLDEQTIWRHYEVMYGIWERVRQRHPKLILENCAGGGGRTDLGMVSRTDFTWFSDYALAPRAVRMQQGIMLALPPERLARFTGVVMNGHLGGDLDMQLRMNMLLGNPCVSGVWPTLAEKNPAAFERLRRSVNFFKRHVRPLINTCRVYHHTEPPSGEPVTDWQPEGWCVFEYAAPDASKAIGALFRLAGQAEPEYRFVFRGLRRDRVYRVQLDNTGESFTASGRELVETGILVRLSRPMTSELITAELEK